MSAIAPPVARLEGSLRGPAVLLGGGAVVAGVLAGHFVDTGRPMLVLALGLVLLPLVLWHRPELGPVLLVGTALTIEQFPEIAGSTSLGLTAKIPLFHGLGGFRPSDLLLLLLLGISRAKRTAAVATSDPPSALARSVHWFGGAVAFAVLFGVGTGGSPRIALTEARPYIYLVLAFLCTSRLATTRGAFRGVLWAFVVGSGFKACQGLLLFLAVHHQIPRPEAVLGHEESLFFGLFMLLTLALWLYGVRVGSLRKTATFLLPVVLAADLANGRRTAWIVLPVGLVILIATGIVCLPARRPFLAKVAIGIAVVSAFYFPAFWNKTGGFAQPARAFHSAVSPDPRDASSNLYRLQEDANLKFNIRMAGPLGAGFGHRIDYALPIVDISDIDPLIAYIPHNGVWYLFLRFGVAGTICFWSVLGIGIIAGCRLARCPDREFAVVGMLLACALPAYALLGYNDQGFFYYRVAFVIGALLGLAEAARRLVPEAATVSAPVLSLRPAVKA